ncbi:MAG TPA: ribokinase [Euzebyales bacterium]|nr:ribokinase [Euzebyales bacterium]
MAVRAVVVGSLVMDLAFTVDVRPGPGDVVIASDFARFRGGKGYNHAVALARMGAEVCMIGAVGRDPYGDAFLAALEHENVDASRVVQLRGTPTAVAVPLITPDGAVGYVQYPGANRLLAAAHCADLPDCDVLLLQGEVSAATSCHAARIIRGRGGHVMLNPTPVEELTDSLLEVPTVIAMNQHDARRLLGVDADVDGLELARLLHTEGRAAVVTMGAGGAAWADDDGEGSARPPVVDASDTTGAGSSFNAALAISIAEDTSLEDAVRLANAAGAYSSTVIGAEPSLPTRAQAEALLVPASA